MSLHLVILADETPKTSTNLNNLRFIWTVQGRPARRAAATSDPDSYKV